MTALNLSNIKRVGFIENFNPKKGYPEFSRKEEKEEAKVVKLTPKNEILKEKFIEGWKKRLIKRIKWEKKKFKRSVGPNYKPQILTSNKLD